MPTEPKSSAPQRRFSYRLAPDPEDMVINLEGWSGNFFDKWTRSASQVELFPLYQFALKETAWPSSVEGRVDFNRRSYSGTDQSHPFQLTRQDGSIAE